MKIQTLSAREAKSVRTGCKSSTAHDGLNNFFSNKLGILELPEFWITLVDFYFFFYVQLWKCFLNCSFNFIHFSVIFDTIYDPNVNKSFSTIAKLLPLYYWTGLLSHSNLK